jgi:nucleoside phosphorylase
MTAARAMLDEEHEPLKSQDAQDSNSYVLGQVYQHNVVIACLPAGVYGTNATATVAMNMLRTFTGIRFSLLVGIGGGIPDLAKGIDIRLGDVVVSQPDQTYGGVVQYDLGKKLGKGSFERKGSLNKPPPALLTALSVIQSKSGTYTRRVSDNVSAMIQKPDLADQGYAFPGVDRDYLFCARCDQSQWRLWSCNKCDNGKISRPPNRTGPKLHCGIIASGNALIKNAAERDRLRNEFGAKCVEMEAAGLMDEFPCIVIRGICDYADSHKNDVWQKYAAVTAAAFAKELLSVVSPIVVGATKHTAEAMSESNPTSL